MRNDTSLLYHSKDNNLVEELDNLFRCCATMIHSFPGVCCVLIASRLYIKVAFTAVSRYSMPLSNCI